jgi:hypothetical protein
MRHLFRLNAHASAIRTAFTAFANAKFKLDERLARWLVDGSRPRRQTAYTGASFGQAEQEYERLLQ